MPSFLIVQMQSKFAAPSWEKYRQVKPHWFVAQRRFVFVGSTARLVLVSVPLIESARGKAVDWRPSTEK